MGALLCPHMSKPVCHPRFVNSKDKMEMGNSFITRMGDSCRTQLLLDRVTELLLRITATVKMYQEFVLIKGLNNIIH